jgi:DNA-directed RNA polymerase specialized sigma24 family protein
VSAQEELRGGRLGPEFAVLLYRCVRVAGRAHNFPPPEGQAAWTAEAAIETGHEFLRSANIQRRLVEIAVQADDDEQLARILTQAVVNFLREQARRTARGRLIRRIKEVLLTDRRFMIVPKGTPGAGNVMLTGASTTEPFGGRESDLIAAAFDVKEVAVVRWRPGARRDGPLSDRDSLVKVAEAVLAAADASLRWADLAAVVSARFGVDPRGIPATTPVDDLDGNLNDSRRGLSSEPAGPGQELLQQAIARAVLDELTDREILVLAWLASPVRTIADRTGLAVSTAGVLKQRVTDRLRKMLADEPDAEAVALTCRDLAAAELKIDPESR